MEESVVKLVPRYPKKKVETCTSINPTTGRQCGLPATHIGRCSCGMAHPTWDKNLPQEVSEHKIYQPAETTNSMLFGNTSDCEEHCSAIVKLVAALKQYGRHAYHECLYEQMPDKSFKHRGTVTSCRCGLANVIAQYENLYG